MTQARAPDVRLLGWSGYDDEMAALFMAFAARTGITVRFHGCRNQDEMLAHAKGLAARGERADVASPTSDRIASWMNAGLVQPWDEEAIHFAGIDPRYHADAQTLVDGRRMGSPNLWGSAGLGHHRTLAPLVPGEARLMDLFDTAHAGRVAMREDTAFVAAGRALAAVGRLPHPFDDVYRDEARMVANYDVILAFLTRHKPKVARFWFSEEEGQEAFRSGACAIGYAWDTSIAALRKEGLAFDFVAPVEGAACYLQNFVLLEGAPNRDASQAWVAWVNTPEGGAAYAAAFGACSPARGAPALMAPADRAFFAQAYPEQALARLWWQPVQPHWFAARRADYARAYLAA